MPFSRTEAVILQQQQQIQYGCRSSKRNRAAAQVQYHTTIAGGHLSGEVYTMRLPFEPDSKSIFIDRELIKAYFGSTLAEELQTHSRHDGSSQKDRC